VPQPETLRTWLHEALPRHLEKGERTLVTVLVLEGPNPWLLLWIVGPVVFALSVSLDLAGTPEPFRTWTVPLLLGAVVGIGFGVLQRPRYAVLTDRRVLFLEAGRWGYRPGGLAFADPRRDVAITGGRRGWTSSPLKYRRPDGRELRLNGLRPWQEDLDRFQQALGG
jgi:hypothetical protein